MRRERILNGNHLMNDGDKTATLVEQRAIFHRQEGLLPVGNYENTELTSNRCKDGQCSVYIHVRKNETRHTLHQLAIYAY